jgi:phage shock protein PspC (stress-responsive transcriptional regulator)
MAQEPDPNRVLRTRRRVVAGVAGGFGRYFAVDPNVVRIVLVLLAFAGGIGILLYLAAWLIVPEEPLDAPQPAGDGGARPRSNVLVIVLVGLLLSNGGLIWP